MSRGSESITELRKICQESRYENEGGMPWFERNFYRRISIYFTKVFLKTGMSANQVTVIGALIGLIAGLFLAFANPLYWIIGVLFFYLVLIFDRVDGEVARYKNLASPGGRIWIASLVSGYPHTDWHVCLLEFIMHFTISPYSYSDF